ncbi:galactokinase [Nocardioides marmoribigeumensis]|uniref:Galactokinase n=1 Tax=Nocardioides marmoribigeumensis TaxID=433649 RepID=A0ABU2BX97_9ACTN|nr:galactokinase [Nocardioides marmoribigeumensis]MDR7363012.1 galactokinase [Nocardioides marmoribigeumensis]
MTQPTVHARWAAPGRVNLIGEHTDYAGGLALPFALPQTCVADVRRREGTRWTARSAQADETVEVEAGELPDDVPGWAAYVLGPLVVLHRRGVEVPGLEVVIDSDVPLGAGLSSSAAVVCSVTVALGEVLGTGLDAEALLALSRAAENDVVGAPTGGLDQLASLRAEEGHALLCDFRDPEHPKSRQVGFDLSGHGLAVLVVDTRAPHAHADNEYAARREACTRAAEVLGPLREIDPDDVEPALDRLPEEDDGDGPGLRGCVRHQVGENARVEQVVALLDQGRVEEIGPLLSASHASLRDVYRVTVPQLDVAAAAAEAGGALGARMTGGGFGGSVIALVERPRADAVGEAVREAFAEHGWDEPRGWVTTAAAGAHRADDPAGGTR